MWAHRGAPWEFNLRDLTRWCTLVQEDIGADKLQAACKHVYLIYSERLRSAGDRKKVCFSNFGHNMPGINFYSADCLILVIFCVLYSTIL